MGEIRNYQCECGYEEKMFPGIGLRAKNIRLVERFFGEETKKIIDKDWFVSTYMIGNTLVECKNCRRVYSVPCLTYKETSESEESKIIGKCNECMSDIFEYEDIDNIHCPKCSRLMKYEVIGNWD